MISYIGTPIINPGTSYIHSVFLFCAYNLILLLGLLFLYFGSKYFVIGSKMLAEYFDVSEAIVGITIVAFGTSLPELSTGVAAALKKQSNLYSFNNSFDI